jgi:hypothetical protein
MSTDSLSLFDVIIKESTTAEKRLMIDLVVVREAYDRMEIALLAFLRTNWNPADPLIKISPNTFLETILTTGTIDHSVAQWVWSFAGACSHKREVARVSMPRSKPV